jgi:large subunit ribosomal protein L24
MTKVKLKKNDKVIVITGKDKGKVGSILAVFAKESKVLVSGVNIVTKHEKASKLNHTGGIVKTESKIHISNVAFFDSESGKKSKIANGFDESKSRIRVAKATGATIADNQG